MFLGCRRLPVRIPLQTSGNGKRATEDLAADPTTTSLLLEKAADFGVALARPPACVIRLIGCSIGDDVAGQTAMIMSPAVWRRMIKPHLARIVAVGKDHNVPVAYHCCGAVGPIIPDLIEIGVDVLNSGANHLPGMDPGGMKNQYGRDLTFMGGIDTVSLLPHGTPAEVYDASRRLIDILARDGGYILSASHTVPPETPIENILAMYPRSRTYALSHDHYFAGGRTMNGAAAAAAAIAQAIKASGALVRIDPEGFKTLVQRSREPLVVIAEGGFFSKKFQYLWGIRV